MVIIIVAIIIAVLWKRIKVSLDANITCSDSDSVPYSLNNFLRSKQMGQTIYRLSLAGLTSLV